MTITTKIALAALVLVSGIAGASQAQAGASTVSFSPDGFENRCLNNGGAFAPFSNGYVCALETVAIGCAFESVYGYCDWEGGQNKREVIAVIGMQDSTSSLSEVGDGRRKKIKLIWNPNLNFPKFP